MATMSPHPTAYAPMLPATDADRHDLTLSCGAMRHHLEVSRAAVELQPEVHRLVTPVEMGGPFRRQV